MYFYLVGLFSIDEKILIKSHNEDYCAIRNDARLQMTGKVNMQNIHFFCLYALMGTLKSRGKSAFTFHTTITRVFRIFQIVHIDFQGSVVLAPVSHNLKKLLKV